MNKMIALGVGAVLLLLLLVFSTTYTVSFDEVAIRKTFGRSTEASVITEPGLKWKWPIIQDKTVYDKRLQIKESPLEEISTADGLQIVVKAFLLWRIDTETAQGPLAFDRAFGSISDADPGIGDPFITVLTGVLSEYRLSDLLGENSRLEEAEAKIVAALSGLPEKGIQPVSVGISQLLLPERTTNSVIRRMQASRTALAEAKRNEGNARAEAITSEAATLAETIRKFADLRASEIRSQAEAKAADYVEQMSEEQSLAIFLVWLDTLEASLNEQSTFVLSTDFAPWHLMGLSSPTDGDGIPQARGGAAATTPSAAQTERQLEQVREQLDRIKTQIAKMPQDAEAREQVEALVAATEAVYQALATQAAPK